MKKILPPIISILIAQSAGLIGSIFTANSVNTWYTTINKPSFNPPSWIFGPVWITLYTLMGIAAFLIWNKKKSSQRTKALFVYGIQLVLNTLWSILFFGLQNPGMAFFEILFLLAFILATICFFFKQSKPAAYLLIPYLAWVSFAAILNYNIWILN